MPYRVAKGNLTNKAREVIATHDSLIELTDLPAPNRTSAPWLIEQGYLVWEDAAPIPDPTPEPPPLPAPSPKRERKE